MPRVELFERARPDGCVLIFPGVINTHTQLANLAELIEDRYPTLGAQVVPWGPAFDSLGNLLAHERNRRTAERFAEAIAAYRAEHPLANIDVVGLSGGGGMAIFTLEALPRDVQVDRLILLAPAVSHEYGLDAALSHVREFAVSFASRCDGTLGVGTRVFGNMDGATSGSAGHEGFRKEDRRLVQVFWSDDMVRYGHYGTHHEYVVTRWLRQYVLPLFDREISRGDLPRIWTRAD
ncbi:MAG: hypothetical protein CHACPFDD_00711 [Phycisphaerae bacterium]|nr:hypothetical protein [Phycisphaerae bacterium]